MDKCLICNKKEITNFREPGSKYKLSRCQSCGLIFEPQEKSNNYNIYNQNYYTNQKIKGGYYNYIEESVVNKLTFKYRLKKIEELTTNKEVKLLDVGCALGDFLEVAKSLLWVNAIGVDVSDYAIKQCQSKGLTAYKISSSQKILKKDSFDVITMQDVIEHYINPQEEMEKIYQMLKTNGVLFMTTPNTKSLSRFLMKKNWYHYKEHEHLFYFNPRNITQMLTSIGFRDIKVMTTPSWVTVKYLVDRLSYYIPGLNNKSISRILQNPLFNIAFPIHTGEMEIWARK